MLCLRKGQCYRGASIGVTLCVQISIFCQWTDVLNFNLKMTSGAFFSLWWCGGFLNNVFVFFFPHSVKVSFRRRTQEQFLSCCSIIWSADLLNNVSSVWGEFNHAFLTESRLLESAFLRLLVLPSWILWYTAVWRKQISRDGVCNCTEGKVT